jgi:hypothetical protein
LPRITLEFALSAPHLQHDLLHEFSLHHDVVAVIEQRDGVCALRVETSDAPLAAWDVRATVGMFDDRATEITGQG